MRKFHQVLLFVLLAWLSANSGRAEQQLLFDAAWVRAMPPGMGMTAGFGQLQNVGAGTIELVSFSSPQFGEVSLHRTELVDGVNRMRAVPSLVIVAGESVALEPGGYHLMLMMPAGPMQQGQRITVEMKAADGRVFRFEMPVERR
jgi:copper(I)-binding protein